jgi:hypothetical protein
VPAELHGSTQDLHCLLEAGQQVAVQLCQQLPLLLLLGALLLLLGSLLLRPGW